MYMNIDYIIKLYKSGNSIRDISREVQVPYSTLRKLLKKNKVEMRSTKVCKNIENEILKKYESGINSEELSREYNLCSTTVCRIIKRCGGTIRSSTENKRKYKIKNDFLDNIDTEEKAYFLGFMWADGNIRKDLSAFKISLHNQDIDILRRFGQMIFKEEYPLYMDRQYPLLYVCSVSLAKRLNDLGCTPNKTFTATFPNCISKDLERHFIRGMFDGDGCIYNNNKKYVVDFTGTQEICKSIIKILNKNNIHNITSYVRHPDRNNNIVSIRIGSRYYVYNFLNYLYKDSNIYLKRKYDKYKKFVDLYSTYIDYDKVLRLREQGKSFPKIGKELGICSSTAWRICNRLG